MADRNIDIKIRSSSDSAAIDKTNKSLDNLDKKQQAASKSAKTSKDAAVSAGQGFAAVGQAASVASSGGLGPLSAALGGLAQQLPALAAAAGPIGLIIAAFTAWKSAIDSVIASGENLKKNLTDISIGNSASAVKRLNDSYKELTDQLSAASAEINRFYNAESAGDDAIKRAELAKLELETAEKRAKLDRSDPFASQKLDLNIARKKAAIEDAAANRGFNRQQQAIDAQTTIASTAKGAAAEQQQILAEQVAGLVAQQMHVTDRATEKAGKWYRTPKGQEEIWAAANQDLTRIATQLEAIKTQMAASIKEQDRAGGELANLSSARDINRLNQSTYSTGQAAARQRFANTSSGIAYDQQQIQVAAAAKQAEEKRNIQKTRSQLQQGVLSAEGNLRTARNSGASSQEVHVLKEELAKARQERAQADKLIIDHAKKTSELAQRTAEALKNLPQ